MTRRRARPSLHETLTEPCGIHASGRTKDPVTLAYEALYQLRAAASGAAVKRLRLLVAPPVSEALQGPVAEALKSIESQLARPVDVVADAGRPAEAFEIMLG